MRAVPKEQKKARKLPVLTSFPEDGVMLQYFKRGKTYYKLNFNKNTCLVVHTDKNNCYVLAHILTDSIVYEATYEQMAVTETVFRRILTMTLDKVYENA
jgi:hypothetical protein